MTRYGIRHECCGLWSWHGKRLVSAEVHQARQHCHAVFDPLWQEAWRHYEIEEKPGSKAHRRAVKLIQSAMRGRAYHYIAHVTGLPEAECHMSRQTDIAKLRLIYRAAINATPPLIRDWWHARKDAA